MDGGRTTSPSASSVVVATPSRTVASYALSVSEQVAEQPGGAVDAEHQHAGRHRVEGAGVADLAGAGEPAYPGDDVVRRQPGRLVDDDETALRMIEPSKRSSSSLSMPLLGEVQGVVAEEHLKVLVGVRLTGVRPGSGPTRQSVAGDVDLLGVDHHQVIAGINVRGVNRLVLAAQTAGQLGGQTAQRLAGCVDEVPVTLDGLGLGVKYS